MSAIFFYRYPIFDVCFELIRPKNLELFLFDYFAYSGGYLYIITTASHYTSCIATNSGEYTTHEENCSLLQDILNI